MMREKFTKRNHKSVYVDQSIDSVTHQCVYCVLQFAVVRSYLLSLSLQRLEIVGDVLQFFFKFSTFTETQETMMIISST